MATDNGSDVLPHIGLILLAAGGSSRMGRPKQLLPFRGHTLLGNAVDIAIASLCDPVVVVLGSDSNEIAPTLEGLRVSMAINADWEFGIGTSIRVGIEKLQSLSPQTNAVVIMLCDQPMVTTEFIDDLVRTYVDTGSIIVASEYGDGVGVPALFSSDMFPALLDLPPGSGAKQIIESLADEAARVIFPAGGVDIDTPEDYNSVITVAGDPPHPAA